MMFFFLTVPIFSVFSSSFPFVHLSCDPRFPFLQKCKSSVSFFSFSFFFTTAAPGL